MSSRILYGKEFLPDIIGDTKFEVEKMQECFNVYAKLVVIMVGEDPASKIYVRNKQKICKELGIISEVIALPENTSKNTLIKRINELNNDKSVHGILLQLPLPEGLRRYSNEILEQIDPLKDVDGFHPMNVGKLFNGNPAIISCTPAACMELLKYAGIKVEGKRAVVIGRSNIVGKPMAYLLLKRNATVTICHSYTNNLAEITREAEVLVSAVGKPNFITADMVRPESIVLDIGISRVGDEIVGDVDFFAVRDMVSAITPVPHGVGVLTVAMLMKNVVKATKMQTGIK